MTPREELEHVNAALAGVLAEGKRYKIGSREKENLDYLTLLQRKKELEAELADASMLMPHTSVAVFGSR